MTTARRLDVYLYGLTVWTTAHRLSGPYPNPDTYGEILETHQFPGGETGNSALILANLGYQVKIDGPFLGKNTRDPVTTFYRKHGVDCSALTFDPDYPGVEDLVLVAEGSRTVFGRFGAYFNGLRRWSKPDPESIAEARMVTIDPFFGEESNLAAELCVQYGKPYVTIDCSPDSYLHRNAAATVVSNEFMQHRFPAISPIDLIGDYSKQTCGLVIFTRGSKEILWCRRTQPVEKAEAFSVEVKSTLGAGDTFRAGVAHGLLSGMNDRETVRFAAATAACVCRRFPMAFDPPGLEEIATLVATQ